jgi:hypothetical protein
MNRLSLSTFLTITALSVAGLVSHSSAHKGHLQPNLRRRRHSRGRASRSWPPVDRRGSCRAAQKIGVGLGVDCVRPIVQGTAQRRKASKALPQVDQQIVAACKARNPNFGKANASPQGQTPPGMQPAPEGSSKTTVAPEKGK